MGLALNNKLNTLQKSPSDHKKLLSTLPRAGLPFGKR
jgi:hypothetical protein